MLMLPYIINSPVQDCLISFFVKVATKYEAPERGVILEKILESGFVDVLFNIILQSSKLFLTFRKPRYPIKLFDFI
jgi:hypothetical protein